MGFSCTDGMARDRAQRVVQIARSPCWAWRLDHDGRMTNGAPGTLGWARQVFADELDRLGVACDSRIVLDEHLDDLAARVGVSRAYLVRTYLTDEAIRSIARQVAATGTDRDIDLLEAAATVAAEHPETAAWPDEVRDYLIDDVATGTAAARYASVFTAGRVGVEHLGLLRYRDLDPTGLADQLGYGTDGLVPVVTIQHRDLLGQIGPLRADPRWGRPRFEWAYQIIGAHYAQQHEQPGGRPLWAWADLPTVICAHRPDLATPDAQAQLAAVSPCNTVVVAARVPIERCLFTSHVLFDALMLRGRYIPADLDDAHAMHQRHGRCQLDRLDPDDPGHQAIIASWTQRILLAPHDWLDVRLQACIDRIEPDEIISVTPLPATTPPPSDNPSQDGVEPELLT